MRVIQMGCAGFAARAMSRVRLYAFGTVAFATRRQGIFPWSARRRWHFDSDRGCFRRSMDFTKSGKEMFQADGCSRWK